MRNKMAVLVGMVAVLAYSGWATATPRVIRYQGRLTDAAGQAIITPTTVVFSFYATETGGSPLLGFSDTDTVTPNEDGIYTTLVGDPTPGVEIPLEVFNSDVVYLNVNVGGEDQSPRMLVTPSAYALDAQTLNGYGLSHFQTGTQEFTAGGAITAGDLVGMDFEGQVRRLGLPQTNSSPFSALELSSISMVPLDTNKVLVSYIDQSSTYDLRCQIATVSGTTVSYGDPVVFENEGLTWYVISSVQLAPNKVLLVYSGGVLRARVATVTGDTISLGDMVEIEPSGVGYTYSVAAVAADRAVVAYDDGDGDGRARVLTVEGTEITVGDVTVFGSSGVVPINVVQLDADKFLLTFSNYDDYFGRVIVGTVSGTTFNLGPPVIFDYSQQISYSNLASVNLGPDKALLIFYYGAVVVVSVSGDTPSIGVSDRIAFSSFNPPIYWPVRLASNRVFAAFYDPANNQTWGTVIAIGGMTPKVGELYVIHGIPSDPQCAVALGNNRALVGVHTAPGGSCDVVSDLLAPGLKQYFGVAEQTVSGGSSCQVTVGGGITGQFHDLVPGMQYYTTYSGLNLIPTSPLVAAGRGIASDRFLVQPANYWGN